MKIPFTLPKIKIPGKKFLPIFYILIVLAISINFLLGLPKAISLVETKASADNIPNNKILSEVEAKEMVAGVQKVNKIPKDQGILPPNISANGVLIEDFNSGFIFYTKDPNKRLPIASTTKIMTAMVAAAYFKPNEVLTATSTSLANGSSMGLKAGEQITFRSLLYGLLLNSGNDAAFTIAANYPGGVAGFVAAMNKKGQELGLSNTHFDNPAGFDNPNHYSSASDLAKIASLAAQDSQFARVVSTKETIVESLDKEMVHPLKNLNKLLNIPGVLGIKTGFTPQAKENLIGLIERDNHKVLTIVLGSDDRFGETQSLIEWVYSDFTWE